MSIPDPTDMKRVVVLGNSGSGKSDLARRMGARLGLPVIYLDRVFWGPGWVAAQRDAFRETVRKMAADDAWIMDGNYQSCLDDRLERADAVVFLDSPRWRCLVRLLRRVLSTAGQSRPDLPDGCRETFVGNFELIRWMWGFPREDRRLILEKPDLHARGKQVFILRDPGRVEDFLANLSRSDMTGKINYDDGLYKNYDEARSLVPQAREAWLEAVRRHLPARPGLKIADMGSGTGRFSELLAEGLKAEVRGIEPSDKMRNVALEKGAFPGVRYMAGSAEKLPLADGEYDAAWLSMVIHHIGDLGACVSELASILKDDGVVLIRNSFAGRLRDIPFYDYFPTGIAVDEARLPSVDRLREVFTAGGFSFTALEGVRQVMARSPREYLDRIRKKSISTLVLIPEEDYRAGLKRLEEDVTSGRCQGPIIEVIELLVFRKRRVG
jgi:adenylate kinase family enzyme/SAM-dependent methyltransferase